MEPIGSNYKLEGTQLEGTKMPTPPENALSAVVTADHANVLDHIDSESVLCTKDAVGLRRLRALRSKKQEQQQQDSSRAATPSVALNAPVAYNVLMEKENIVARVEGSRKHNAVPPLSKDADLARRWLELGPRCAADVRRDQP